MEALSNFANYLTRGVQRRVEMMVAYKVEAKLDRYIPDGFSYTDAVKMQIAIYIAKGLAVGLGWFGLHGWRGGWSSAFIPSSLQDFCHPVATFAISV
ncbi:unnamed protein product [Closterium sp. Yama58-4]|nr:unnamed protein product [Closterium sp. Yama58-4]